MENYEEDITKYPTPDKQYDGAKKYETYESLQTGAMGTSSLQSKRLRLLSLLSLQEGASLSVVVCVG